MGVVLLGALKTEEQPALNVLLQLLLLLLLVVVRAEATWLRVVRVVRDAAPSANVSWTVVESANWVMSLRGRKARNHHRCHVVFP